MTLIENRPTEVEQRRAPGHGEGGLVKGKQNFSQVGTSVERTTLYVVLIKLENGRAEKAAQGFGCSTASTPPCAADDLRSGPEKDKSRTSPRYRI